MRAGVKIERTVLEAHDAADTLALIEESPTSTGDQFTQLLLDEDIRQVPGDLDQIIDSLIADALEYGASDIHLEATRDQSESLISYRVGNNIICRSNITPALAQRMATVIRERAGIDTANTATAFDGDFRFQFHKRPIDLRVAVLPTTGGQKITMRLADPAAFASLDDIFGVYPRLNARQKEAETVSRRGNLSIVAGPITREINHASRTNSLNSTP